MKRGCQNGCVHHREIKLPEMKEQYAFRCAAIGIYMREEDIKKSCRHYQPPYKVRNITIEDFIE